MAPLSRHHLAVAITAVLLLALAQAHDDCPDKYCTIGGLPADAVRSDNVYSLVRNVDTLNLFLYCNCSRLTPKWERKDIGSASVFELGSNRQCINKTKPCTDRSMNTIPLGNESEGLYISGEGNFTLTKPTTVIMCFSDIVREEILVVTLLGSQAEPAEETTIAPTSTAVDASTIAPTVVIESTSSTSTAVTETTVIITSTVTVSTTHVRHITDTVTVTGSCSNTILTTPTIRDQTATLNNIVEKVGPSTLALVPVVLVLLLLSITLCGVVMCVRARKGQEIRNMQDEIDKLQHRRDSNSSINKTSSLDRLLNQSNQRKRSDCTNPCFVSTPYTSSPSVTVMDRAGEDVNTVTVYPNCITASPSSTEV